MRDEVFVLGGELLLRATQENTTSFNFQAQHKHCGNILYSYKMYSKDLPLQISVTFHKSTGGVCVSVQGC